MPFDIATPEVPGHKVTLDATDPEHPGRCLATCSCGETVYESEQTNLQSALEVVAAVTAHYRANGWRDPRLN